MKRKIIPNKLLLFMLMSGIFLNSFVHIIGWVQAIIRMIAAGAALFSIRLIGQFLFQKESMGVGDIKLAGVIGFYIGWELFWVALFSGSLISLFITFIVNIFKDKSAPTRIPFAPYLSTGCLIALLWGQDLWSCYLKLILTG